jgi:hypothetical protein
MNEMEQIFTSDLPEMEKLSRSFDWVIKFYVTHSEREIELFRAMGDKEELIKEQIKLSTIEHVRGIFAYCFLKTTGRKAWDEPTS